MTQEDPTIGNIYKNHVPTPERTVKNFMLARVALQLVWAYALYVAIDTNNRLAMAMSSVLWLVIIVNSMVNRWLYNDMAALCERVIMDYARAAAYTEHMRDVIGAAVKNAPAAEVDVKRSMN